MAMARWAAARARRLLRWGKAVGWTILDVPLCDLGTVPAVAKQAGGGRTRVGEPDTKETGRPEGLPRTTAIDMVGKQKTPTMAVALMRLCVIRSPNPAERFSSTIDTLAVAGGRVKAWSAGLSNLAAVLDLYDWQLVGGAYAHAVGSGRSGDGRGAPAAREG